MAAISGKTKECPKCHKSSLYVYVFDRCDVCIKDMTYRAPNNETYGKTVEYAICCLSNIEISKNFEGRFNPLTITEAELASLEKELSKIPKVKSFSGDNTSVDFILEGGKTLNVKTIIRNCKVCPGKIGQATRKNLWNISSHYLLNIKRLK